MSKISLKSILKKTFKKSKATKSKKKVKAQKASKLKKVKKKVNKLPKKLIIVESLWEIIYSDNESDMYEANLMRRLTGLLYLDQKKVGEIKEKINLKLK